MRWTFLLHPVELLPEAVVKTPKEFAHFEPGDVAEDEKKEEYENNNQPCHAAPPEICNLS